MPSCPPLFESRPWSPLTRSGATKPKPFVTLYRFAVPRRSRPPEGASWVGGGCCSNVCCRFARRTSHVIASDVSVLQEVEVAQERLRGLIRHRIFDVEQRRGGGAALEGFRGALARAGEDKGHVIAPLPTSSADDLFNNV